MRFTARYKRASGDQALVLEDAPRPTRIGYIKGVLADFVGTGSRWGKEKEPLDVSEVHQRFCALIRDEADPWDYDSEGAWPALVAHLKDCSWLEFYDFVELAGKLLIELEDDPFASSKLFLFKSYQTRTNALLEEDGIGWSLNSNSELARQTPKALAQRTAKVQSSLGNRFAAARGHYQKAHTYLFKHPIDEANSVKEMVSALESVARTVVPGTATLGDAIKVLKKKENAPKHLLEAMEKLYVYANATPMVRHGHPSPGSVSRNEAELAFHVGVAFIRYLMESEVGHA